MRDNGDDVLAHLEAELAECNADVKRNPNLSADWWRARASGISHAIDLIERERYEKAEEAPRA